MAAASCLLCVGNFDDTIGPIDIDSAEAQELRVKQIIEQYFSEEVEKSSTSSMRTVCRPCWEAVSTFHQFYVRVKHTHMTLIEFCSKEGSPPASEEQIGENKVEIESKVKIEIESLHPLPNESNTLVVDLHPNDIKQEQVEFVAVDSTTDEEHSDEISSSEDAFGSGKEQLPETKQIKREKSFKADAFIAENFEITCHVCGFAVKTFADLQLHFQTEHQTSAYVICCGHKLKRRASLVDHLYLHRNPHHFKCPKCGKNVSSSGALRKHVRAHRNTRERLFKCETCSKAFSSRATLKRHAEIHMQERPYPCAECDKAYPSKKALTHHSKVVHQNAYARICDTCGKILVGDKQLQRHMQGHTGQKLSIKCDKCDRILASQHGLKVHMQTMHQAQSQTCPICSKVSKSMRGHRRHMNYMHELTAKHACKLCDKSFKRIAHLKEHIRSHTKEVSFACIFCPRMYSTESSRYLHYKKNHPEEWEERRKSSRLENAVEQSEQ